MKVQEAWDEWLKTQHPSFNTRDNFKMFEAGYEIFQPQLKQRTKILIETQKREHKKELFIDELLSKHSQRSATLAKIRTAISEFDDHPIAGK